MDIEILGVLLARAFVATAMISVGFQVSVPAIVSLHRRPRIVVAALAVSFIVLPLGAAALSSALAFEPSVAVGFVVLGCAAGATMGVKLAEIAHADVADSVALMFVLAATTAFALGPSAAFLLDAIGASGAGLPSLDPLAVLALLAVTQLGPLVLGLLVHHRWPALVRRARPAFISATTVLLVATIAVLVVDAIDEMIVLGPVPFAAMGVLVLLGVVAGHVAAGHGHEQRRAVALLSGQRSAAVAFLAVDGLGLPLATATVVVCGICMLAVTSGVALAWRLREGPSVVEAATRRRGELGDDAGLSGVG